MTVPPPPRWHRKAAWAGQPVKWFYPERGMRADAARAICDSCPVQRPCLQWALEHDEEFGVDGGLTPRERRALGRQAA